MQTTQPKDRGSDVTTRGVRVRVKPAFLAGQSRPEQSQFVWAYRVTITNDGAGGVQLLTRRWLIVDADGDRRIVEGEGVVGNQPHLLPGQSFEYTSHAPLETPWGTMEGTYGFVDDHGAEFEVVVGRFYLVA